MTRLQEYLNLVEESSVNADLSKNASLVASLTDWKESWRTFRQHAMGDELVTPVCAFVRHLHDVSCRVRDLSKILEYLDPVVFAVLPRLLLLCYLREPDMYHSTLHDLGQLSSQPENLNKLRLQYNRAQHAMCSDADAGASDGVAAADTAAAELQLEECVVCHEGPYQNAVSAFLVSLEEVSIQLQRHDPTQWNLWAMDVLQCFRRIRDAPAGGVPLSAQCD